jgi:hypothetical protein
MEQRKEKVQVVVEFLKEGFLQAPPSLEGV